MKRKINYIAIHCTATLRSAKVESIMNYWKNELGWKNPGYHVLIEESGLTHYLLPFDKVSNGVRGYNKETINIAYIGGKDFDNRTNAQKESLIRAIKEALEYAKPHIPIIQGHRDFPNVSKKCPNFNAILEYKHLRNG